MCREGTSDPLRRTTPVDNKVVEAANQIEIIIGFRTTGIREFEKYSE